MTASSAYDFGTNLGLSNALLFTRMGKDLQISMGVTYNAILNSDFPAIQGFVLLVTFIYLVIYLLLDIVTAALDPRVKF